MKRRPDKPDDPEEPLLFDLPLGGPDRLDEPEEPLLERKRPARESRPAPVAPELPLAGRSARPVPVPALEDDEDDGFEAETAAGDGSAGRAPRLAAGLADLVVHAALGVAAVLGVRGLGVKLDLTQWPAFAVFLVAFSFLYTVLPLAFWGHTPGMAWAGITSRNQDGEALTFDQTARRWLGGLVTALLLGLPLLVLVKGRSLADLISGSATYIQEEGT
ncbi:MAG TPA: RDD family protein [Thermoanaerobaculia bacterium]|nr:RDD family protein [Thermoanaerobaculia bacterium]